MTSIQSSQKISRHRLTNLPEVSSLQNHLLILTSSFTCFISLSEQWQDPHNSSVLSHSLYANASSPHALNLPFFPSLYALSAVLSQFTWFCYSVIQRVAAYHSGSLGSGTRARSTPALRSLIWARHSILCVSWYVQGIRYSLISQPPHGIIQLTWPAILSKLFHQNTALSPGTFLTLHSYRVL